MSVQKSRTTWKSRSCSGTDKCRCSHDVDETRLGRDVHAQPGQMCRWVHQPHTLHMARVERRHTQRRRLVAGSTIAAPAVVDVQAWGRCRSSGGRCRGCSGSGVQERAVAVAATTCRHLHNKGSGVIYMGSCLEQSNLPRTETVYPGYWLRTQIHSRCAWVNRLAPRNSARRIVPPSSGAALQQHPRMHASHFVATMHSKWHVHTAGGATMHAFIQPSGVCMAACTRTTCSR